MFIARPYFIEGEYSTKIVNKNLQVLARWFLDTFFPYSLVSYFVFKMCGDTENCKFNTYTAQRYIDKMRFSAELELRDLYGERFGIIRRIKLFGRVLNVSIARHIANTNRSGSHQELNKMAHII